MTPNTSFNLRPATHDDLEAITNIACGAFQGSPIYDHFSPHHSDDPNTFRRFLRNELRGRMLSPGQVIIVAVAPAKCVQSQPWPERDARMEPEDTEIVGYSVWILRGANKVPIQWNQDSFWRRFNRMLLMLEEQLYFFFSPDCTTSFKTIHFFHSTAAAILKDNGVEEHIELNTLAVHPGRQRMGIGASLMKWGLSKASGEGSRVVLEATEVGLGLYEKMGFRKMGAVFLEDKKVDGKLIESLVVPVMVWNPSKDRGERGGK